MNYEATTGQTWDRWIEKIDAHDGTKGDKLEFGIIHLQAIGWRLDTI